MAQRERVRVGGPGSGPQADTARAPSARQLPRTDHQAPSATSNAGVARLIRSQLAGPDAAAGPGEAALRAGSAGPEIEFAHPRRGSLHLMSVSQPGDPFEREAEAVASRVVHGHAPQLAPTPASTRVSREPADGAPSGVPEPSAVGAVEAADVAAGGEVPVSAQVTSLVASPGAGEPLEPGVRARIEPHLGADLSRASVHRGPEVSTAAGELQARAFTVGADIFLGAGESPTDLELMAHEATHVVQQQAVGVYRAEVMRSIAEYAPDWILDPVRSLPGYSIVTAIMGSDPLTGEPAAASRQAFVEKLLTYGPFGAAVGPLLSSIKILDDVFTLLSEALGRHDLTLARIGRDFEAAWDEMSITESVDFNLAIGRRYLDGILTDVSAFIDDVVAVVIAKVRAIVAEVAEPFLQKPAIAPYWNLAIKVLHTNPITGAEVPASTVEIITDFLHLLGQDDVLAQMTERGTLQQTADWLDGMIGRFKGLIGQVGALLDEAKSAISPENLPNLLDTLPALADKVLGLVHQVGDFATDVIAQVLVLVKKSLLEWLSSYARKVPGYELLTVILEKDPFTEAKVPRTAENLIKGFIYLLPNGEAMYAKLAESGVIANAAARIEGAMARLNISWQLITDTFLGVWNLATLENLLKPIDTFDKILDTFGEPLGRIIEFAAEVVGVVIELILRLMNFPPELLGNIIANAMAAIDDIKKDPIEFLMNLVGAMKEGFGGFFNNIAQYLLKGLSDWMFRGLRTLGIEPPSALTLEAAIALVIQVSGVTMEMIWAKLAAKLGEETVQKIRGAIELAGEAFAFIKDIQERGIEAIWERIAEKVSNLWDLIFDAAKQWIMKEIVDKAVAKVLSMLDPTGIMAVINGTIAFFKAVQSVLDYIRELIELVDQYVSTIASIAKGNVGPGAAKLEKGLADAVPVAIGFLANQAGISDMPEQVKQIVIDLRVKIDEGIDWLIDKAVAMGKAALDALGLGGAKAQDADLDKPFVVDEPVEAPDGGHHVRSDGPDGALVMHSDAIPVAQMPDANKFQPEVNAYTAARKAYDDERAKEPRDKAQLTARRDALDAATIALMEKVRAFALLDPGASAPGVGTIEKHGMQGARIVDATRYKNARAPGPKIWQTRSEHVLPFREGSFLWYVLGGELPGRGSQLDKDQTTIITYQGAANLKDTWDYSGIAQSKSIVLSAFTALKTAVEVQLEFEEASRGSSGGKTSDSVDKFREYMYALHASMTAASAEAASKTAEFVATESASVEQGVSDKANRVRRGPPNSPEPIVPEPSDVSAAAEKQLAEVRALFEASWTAQARELGIHDAQLAALEITAD